MFTIFSTKLNKPILYVALAICAAVLISSCTNNSSTSVEADVLYQANRFVEAIENNEAATAFALLTKDARSKVDYERFSTAKGDFEGIIQAFRQSDIVSRNKRPKTEPSFYVANRRGREGIVKFVLVMENGDWKVANVLEEP